MDFDIGGLAKEALLDEDKVNNGVWVQLYAATIDENGDYPPLCLGGDPDKPQRAKVRSQRCRAIKEAGKGRQKQGFVKMRTAKKKDRDGVIIDSSILPDDERFSHILVALDNFGTKGGVQNVSPVDAKAIHGMDALDEIVDQIIAAALDDSLYMADADTPVGKESPSSLTTAKTPPENRISES